MRSRAIDADGFLSITGRKKDLIITFSGKNIIPSNLETALRESRWISEAVVFGDSRPYLIWWPCSRSTATSSPPSRTAPDRRAMVDDPASSR